MGFIDCSRIDGIFSIFMSRIQGNFLVPNWGTRRTSASKVGALGFCEFLVENQLQSEFNNYLHAQPLHDDGFQAADLPIECSFQLSFGG